MNQEPDEDTLREEYDFSSGVRGKHYTAYRQGTNLVLISSRTSVASGGVLTRVASRALGARAQAVTYTHSSWERLR
jgi:hypothetical protein